MDVNMLSLGVIIGTYFIKRCQTAKIGTQFISSVF